MKFSWKDFFLFCIGLFSQVRVQLIGMIGISEIIICITAPILFIRDFNSLRRNGFFPVLALWLFVCVGCVVGALFNHTPTPMFLRGFAAPFVILCAIIFLHHFLKKNLNGFKWLVLGLSVSFVLFLYINGVTIEDAIEGEAVHEIGNSNYILSVMIGPLIVAPIIIWYSKLPTLVSFLLTSLDALALILVSSSGRSAALTTFASGLLILVAGRSLSGMTRIKKHFAVYVVLSLLSLCIFKAAYTFSASKGLLGDEAQTKYLAQTKSGSGFLSLLIGGRAESFICLYAALDKPIIGFGPWAQDTEDYATRFIEKYGSAEDYIARIQHSQNLARLGMLERVRSIPFHSYIFGNWVWYGISGLIIWVYALYLIYAYFRKYVDVLPQWFGVMALLLPRFVWDIFFSPIGRRVGAAAIFCAILFLKGIYERRMSIDYSTLKERNSYGV